MTEKDHRLSRRNVLLSLGGIGAGAALAGGSTMAFLHDEESSTGNTVTAGTLDLKIGWEKSYNGNQLPTQTVGNNPGPVFELGDVKPGDHGEATIEIRADGNPAWLWLGGDITAMDDNGLTEPEHSSGDTTGGDADGKGGGELQDETMARIWYDDNCNNVLDGGESGQELEVALVSDVSGSMDGSKLASLKTAAKNFVDNFSSPDEGAAISFTTSGTVDQELTTNYAAIKTAIDGYSAGGGTDIAAGISTAENELLNGTNATASASKVMVLLSDGNSDEDAAKAAATAAKNNGIRIITIALGSGADTSLLESLASSSDDAYVSTSTDLEDVYDDIATTVFTGEEVIASGTLAEVFDVLSQGVALDSDRSTEERDPYQNESACFGFEWWIPKSVGNVIQSDSVDFDLEFYAEQTRHNDNPDNPYATTS